jgi:hypothetical protein
MMDTDDMMLFIRSNPDCSIMDLVYRFDVSAPKAASMANTMVETGWLIKNQIRNLSNGKMVIGYRVHPDWNNVLDNADGSMKVPHVIRILRIQYRHGSKALALKILNAHNDWRLANGKVLIKRADVFA